MPDAKGNVKGQGWSRKREEGWEKAFGPRLAECSFRLTLHPNYEHPDCWTLDELLRKERRLARFAEDHRDGTHDPDRF